MGCLNDPLLRVNSLARAAHRTQRNTLLTRSPVLWKDITQEQMRGEIHRARVGEGWGASGPSPGTLLSPNLHVFPSLALRTMSFWDFMEASLHRRDWLNHGSVETDSTSSLSLLPSQGVGLSSPASLHPSVWSRSHLINITRHTHRSYHSGEFKGFRSSVPEMERRLNMYFVL